MESAAAWNVQTGCRRCNRTHRSPAGDAVRPSDSENFSTRLTVASRDDPQPRERIRRFLNSQRATLREITDRDREVEPRCELLNGTCLRGRTERVHSRHNFACGYSCSHNF